MNRKYKDYKKWYVQWTSNSHTHTTLFLETR